MVDHGVEGCNHLLALDVERTPSRGTRWQTGRKGPAISGSRRTSRRCAASRGSIALPSSFASCKSRRHAGRREPAPSHDRSARAGASGRLHALFASELEFYLYRQSYAEAHERDYRDLTPTIPYILDYHVLATTMDENVLGPIHRGMQVPGNPVEFSKGEAWYGQHEVNTRYADAVTSADRHVIFKNGVNAIAFLIGVSATFTAKPSEKTSVAPATSTRASWMRGAAQARSSTVRKRPTSFATPWAGCELESGSWRCSCPPQ